MAVALVWGQSIKWIPGYVGKYAVTSDGRIATYTRNNPSWLKLSRSRSGHLHVGLVVGSVQKQFEVHRLVLLSFVGEPDSRQVACHINGDPGNNSIYNLRWDSRRGNLWDSFRGKQRGATLDKKRNKYRVLLYFGYYNTKEEALAKYKEGMTILFGSGTRVEG